MGSCCSSWAPHAQTTIIEQKVHPTDQESNLLRHLSPGMVIFMAEKVLQFKALMLLIEVFILSGFFQRQTKVVLDSVG